MPTSTQLTPRFREHLSELRRTLAKLPESPLAESLEIRLDLMAGDMTNGYPVTQEVEVELWTGDHVVTELADAERARLERLAWDAERLLAARRDEAGITSVLDDRASLANGDRDHREAG